jgi:hypothetical protein
VNLLRELVETGRVRTKAELRSVYKSFVKKYHPDSNPGTDKAIDFDELKSDYRSASVRLEELSALRQAPGAAPFRYDPEVFLAEFRDLVARGLPVSAKALGRNKAYAASVAYVSAGIERIYGSAYTFAELNSQLKFLRRKMFSAYYYVLQIFWTSQSLAAGYSYSKLAAERHLGCIDERLIEMGYVSLEKFLRDFIDLSARVGATLDPRLKGC